MHDIASSGLLPTRTCAIHIQYGYFGMMLVENDDDSQGVFVSCLIVSCYWAGCAKKLNQLAWRQKMMHQCSFTSMTVKLPPVKRSCRTGHQLFEQQLYAKVRPPVQAQVAENSITLQKGRLKVHL